jgi:DNA-binding MarR family transcriptional regulator
MNWLNTILGWIEDAWRTVWPVFLSMWNWCFGHGTFRTVMVCIVLFFVIGGLGQAAEEAQIRKSKESSKEEIRKFNSGPSENRAAAASSVLSAILGAPGSSQTELTDKITMDEALLGHVIEQLIAQGHIESSKGLRLTGSGLALYHQYHFNKGGGKVHMGDVIKVGSNSHLVNRSVVINSFSNVESKLAPEAREALGELVQLVLDSENREAEENLHGFLAELEQPEPRKGILKSLLSGVASALPSLVSATSLVENVRKLIVGA